MLVIVCRKELMSSGTYCGSYNNLWSLSAVTGKLEREEYKMTWRKIVEYKQYNVSTRGLPLNTTCCVA